MKYILFIHSFIHIIGKYIAMEEKEKAIKLNRKTGEGVTEL